MKLPSLYGPIKTVLIKVLFARQKTHFYQEVLMLLDSGIALSDALTLMHESYGAQKGMKFKITTQVLAQMRYRMRCGFDTLTDLLSGMVSDNDLLLLSVDSTKSVQALKSILKSSAKFATLSQEVVKGAKTPLICLVLGWASLYGAHYFIFPQILKASGSIRLTGSARALDHFSSVVVSYDYVILALVIALSVLSLRSLPRLTGRLRTFLDYLPPWSIYKQLKAVNLMITLSSLLDSGEPFDESVRALKKSATPYMGQFLGQIEVFRARGKSMGEAMIDARLLSQSASVSLGIFNKSDRFERGLNILASEGLNREIKKIKSLFGVLSLITLTIALAIPLWLFVAVGGIATSI